MGSVSTVSTAQSVVPTTGSESIHTTYLGVPAYRYGRVLEELAKHQRRDNLVILGLLGTYLRLGTSS